MNCSCRIPACSCTAALYDPVHALVAIVDCQDYLCFRGGQRLRAFVKEVLSKRLGCEGVRWELWRKVTLEATAPVTFQALSVELE